MKKLSLCFPSDLRFGINIAIPKGAYFDIFGQRDVLLKRTRKASRQEEKYMFFLENWRPFKRFYRETDVSGLHLDFALSRLHLKDQGYDCDEITMAAASTLKVDFPLFVRREDIEVMENPRLIYDESEDISNEVFYRRVMVHPSFDVSVVEGLTKEIIRSVDGFMTVYPGLQKMIGSTGHFYYKQWLMSVIQIARSMARCQGVEKISEDLLRKGLEATVCTRKQILNAYIGSSADIGVKLGALALRILNYLRKEEEVLEKDVYKHFSNHHGQDIYYALKDLSAEGKVYEPRRGVLRPVPWEE